MRKWAKLLSSFPQHPHLPFVLLLFFLALFREEYWIISYSRGISDYPFGLSESVRSQLKSPIIK